MSKGKFTNLHRYFSQLKEDKVIMTFVEMESIIGEKLSNSAYKYRAYWYDSETHMLPKSWLENGYKMINLDLKKQEVSFIYKETKENIGSSVDKTNDIRSKENSIVNIYKREENLITIEEVINAIQKYNLELESDENARFLSWEHCYKVFQDANTKETINDEKIDYLSLHLAFYLASWGMLRGSSFLIYKDYRVHIEIIKELFKPTYKTLWNINYKGLKEQQNINILMDLIENMKSIYQGKRKNIRKVSAGISDILISKVLLGTMGCMPAYDEYFKKGVGRYNISTQLLGKSSIDGLAEYYDDNSIELEKIRNEISKARGFEYPQMKILDMAFWQLGFDYNRK